MKCKKQYPFEMVFCPSCGAKLVMGRLSLKPVSAPTCQFGCGRTDDLAQCPECHLWFCKEHDSHYCIPQPLTSDLQKRIALLKRVRDLEFYILMAGPLFFLLGMTVFGGLSDEAMEDLGLTSPEAFLKVVAILGLIAVVLFVLGLAILAIVDHYEAQLKKKFGVHYRSIRPQTAKEDR